MVSNNFYPLFKKIIFKNFCGRNYFKYFLLTWEKNNF